MNTLREPDSYAPESKDKESHALIHTKYPVSLKTQMMLLRLSDDL